MFENERTLRNRGILDVIQTLSSNGESGELQIHTGTTAGAFYFRNGLLVDARVGNLKGFQAVNAAASLHDADFAFDPSVAPPPVSSITQSERVVLKQFFGIDAVGPEESHAPEPVVTIAPEESHAPEPMMTVAPEESHAPESVIYAADDEVTLVKRKVPSGEVPSGEVPSPLPYQPSSSPMYSSGLAVAAIVFLLATAAVVLLYKFGDYSPSASVASVATTVQPSSAPAPIAEQVEPKQPVESSKVESNKVEPNDNDTSPASDLTGKWNVVNTVSKTSYSSFNNMEIGFDLSIEQHGKGFTGTGQKVSENGRRLPAGSRTPIQLKGSINGDVVEASFFEQGTARKTNGRFVWRINKAGALTGTFNSTAARTSGKSMARKV